MDVWDFLFYASIGLSYVILALIFLLFIIEKSES